MRRLILLRHGEAAPAAPGAADRDRALTPRGERDARAAGLAIAAAGARPDLVLVSPARRAQETWAAAAPALGAPAMRLEPRLLHTDAAVVLETAQDAGADTVMVVAHNPGLADLAQRLASGGDTDAARAFAARGFPPATAALFSTEGEGGAWRMDAILPPEERA